MSTQYPDDFHKEYQEWLDEHFSYQSQADFLEDEEHLQLQILQEAHEYEEWVKDDNHQRYLDLKGEFDK